jgi:hypothetical protein
MKDHEAPSTRQIDVNQGQSHTFVQRIPNFHADFRRLLLYKAEITLCCSESADLFSSMSDSYPQRLDVDLERASWGLL